MSGDMPAVAIFGGSFNPPHIGHVLAAGYVLSTCNVSAVMVIPVYDHPLNKRLLGFEARLRMCELAFEPLKRVIVSDIERQLGGESRTLDTIEHLLQAQPNRKLHLVIGSDVLAERHKWHRFDRIAELAPPIILGRAGHPHPEAPLAVLPEVSSSSIRARAEQGLPLRGWVPQTVDRFIHTHAHYGTKA